ncbi:MAG: protein phosphatase 2C domain-containing protein [Anaerolineae bacterium]
MQAHVRTLTFPKTEHSAETNEDALAYDAGAGLFVVADGVGSASFSGEWAHVLVEHAIREPLLGDDPFEVEWWLRRAQRRYDERVPRPESLPTFAQEKARQGGASTLVALRLGAAAGEALPAEVLAFGDSCAIVQHRGAAALQSFPLQSADEFSTATVALPARVRYFDRRLHRCRRLPLALGAGDVVILATDAVAKAILGAGGGRLGTAEEAFAAVAEASAADWESLVHLWREGEALADDDATALVIAFGSEGEELGATLAPLPALVTERQAELAAALADDRGEGIAIAYGDGSYFGDGYLDPLLLQRSRLAADAVAEVRAAIMRSLSARHGGQSPAQAWERWAPLLAEEPSAATLRASLQQLGLPLPAPRWPHLLPFREALARADAESAIALAPPEDLAYLLTDGEQCLVQSARQWLARRERLRAGLERGEVDLTDGPSLPGALAAALAGDDDERILLAAAVTGTDDGQADDEARERARLARRRLEALAGLRLALAAGDDDAIVSACPNGLDGHPLLRPSERARIGVARRRLPAGESPPDGEPARGDMGSGAAADAHEQEATPAPDADGEEL